MARSTRLAYRRAWQLYAICLSAMNMTFNGIYDLPLDKSRVMLYIGFLHLKGYASSSITTFVSAIGYVHRIKGFNNPMSTLMVQKLLSAANRLNPRLDTRLPITLTILEQLNLALNETISSSYNRALFQAMFVTAFYGLMRVGELTKDKWGNVALFMTNIKVESDHVALRISKFKHNINGYPFDILLCKQAQISICPYTNILNYLKLRGVKDGPLFCYPNNQPVSREFFVTILKNTLRFCGFNTNEYKSHSFRIGGASYYASLGLSDEQIRILVRWKCDASKFYIRNQMILSAISN